MNYQSCYPLVCYAFNKTHSPQREQAFKELFEHSIPFTRSENNQVVNHLLATPFNISIQNQPLPMLGIGYVASLPEFRGNGGIKQLFIELDSYCQENNIPLTLLAPFSQPFYRQFGYETISQKTTYYFNKEAFTFLPKTKDGEYERYMMTEELIKRLNQSYNEITKQLNGAIIREVWWTNYQTIKHHPRYVVFYTYQNKTSYMLYHMANDTFIIDELIYHNNEHLIALLNFAKSHQMTTPNVQASDPLGYLPHVFKDSQCIKQEIAPYMMACIHQISAFDYVFKQYCPQNAEPCYIQITMPNGKETYYKVDSKNMACLDTTPEKLHYSGSIQAWTQWLLSSMSFEELSYTPSPLYCHNKHPMINKDGVPTKGQTIHLYDYF